MNGGAGRFCFSSFNETFTRLRSRRAETSSRIIALERISLRSLFQSLCPRPIVRTCRIIVTREFRKCEEQQAAAPFVPAKRTRRSVKLGSRTTHGRCVCKRARRRYRYHFTGNDSTHYCLNVCERPLCLVQMNPAT